jgi:YggT family protein
MPVYDVLRLAVLVLAGAALLVALGSWAVTTRRISPFSRLARLIRGVSDPILLPVERWLVTRGRNPQDAPWWLLGIVVVGSILGLTVFQWLWATVANLAAAGRSGPRNTIRLVIYLSAQLVLFALIARVVGSWFGAGRFNRWLRPAYRITDWIVEPLRRFIPPIGIVDITPLAAWLLLQIILSIVLRLIPAAP